MDKKFIYGSFVLLFVILLLGALYLFHYRIKSLETTKLQLQKHVLYHQQIIERYNQLLGTGSISQNNTSIPIPQPLPRMPEQPIQTENSRPSQRQSNPTGGMNMGSILPMVSSIMSMMNPGESNSVENSKEESEKDDKKELESELENELKELQESLQQEEPEGRIDDTNVIPQSDVKEVSSISSEKSVASIDSEYSSDSIQKSKSVSIDEK